MGITRVKGRLPGPKGKKLLEKWHLYEADAVGYQAPVVWETARGCVVTDVDGNRFIDWTSGVLVYVPRETEVTLRLRTVTVGGRGGRAQLPHLLIVADEGSSVVVVDEQLSTGRNGATFELPVTEVLVGRGAKVRHVAVQESCPGARSLAITSPASRLVNE